MPDGGEWCLIESDPGVFTELIRGFGATGLQCEEVYDLMESDNISDAFGLIFLFKWEGKPESAENVVPDARTKGVFFAKQVISNACATQAVINILLNIDESKVELGETLKQFKSFVADFDSQMKGTALGNSDQIRTVHNSFSSQPFFEFDEKLSKSAEESYHFVGYLPINGTLYELDGLKEGPIDHGPVAEHADWIASVRPILQARMKSCVDGKFSLMAVVPDRIVLYEQKLSTLKANPDAMTATLVAELERSIDNERQKMETYRQQNIRRRHNYLPLIVELFKILAENGRLVEAVEKAKNIAVNRKNCKPSLGKA